VVVDIKHPPSLIGGETASQMDSSQESSQKQYSLSRKATYKAKKKRAKRGKVVLERQKVKHTSFKEAHTGIQEAKIEKRRKKDGCTHYSLPADK